jgi:hypothetical protein
MEIKKIIFVCLSILILSSVYTQDTNRLVPNKGLLRAGLSFELGLQNENTQNLYVCANLEYFPSSFIGVRGDIRGHVGATGERPRFSMNHQMLAGLDFMIPTGLDLVPVIFIQPGVALSQSSEYFLTNTDGSYSYEITASPLFSIGAGLQYYAPTIFHVFLEARYTIGQHQVSSGSTYLDEISFSFGLGFHLWTNKRKK